MIVVKDLWIINGILKLKNTIVIYGFIQKQNKNKPIVWIFLYSLRLLYFFKQLSLWEILQKKTLLIVNFFFLHWILALINSIRYFGGCILSIKMSCMCGLYVIELVLLQINFFYYIGRFPLLYLQLILCTFSLNVDYLFYYLEVIPLWVIK